MIRRAKFTEEQWKLLKKYHEMVYSKDKECKKLGMSCFIEDFGKYYFWEFENYDENIEEFMNNKACVYHYRFDIACLYISKSLFRHIAFFEQI